jgi:DNA repair protein RecN (Recombination protein N)
MEALRKQQKRLASDFEKAAAELTEIRKAAAKRLEKRVEAELAQLAMERTVFKVVVTGTGWSASGADEIEFLVSPNLGEEPRPLSKVASGGEISRIALAVKTCLAAGGKSGAVRTLVFDEVDAGVGGRAAVEVGRRLARLATTTQVLVVTHLPQVAAFADRHLLVEKASDGAVTRSGVAQLDDAGRVAELTRMLAGLEGSTTGRAHAEELLATAAGTKRR